MHGQQNFKNMCLKVASLIVVSFLIHAKKGRVLERVCRYLCCDSGKSSNKHE
jgi:hypothetical protein